jgi:hypothetical protein
VLEPLHDDMCVVYGTDDEDGGDHRSPGTDPSHSQPCMPGNTRDLTA